MKTLTLLILVALTACTPRTKSESSEHSDSLRQDSTADALPKITVIAKEEPKRCSFPKWHPSAVSDDPRDTMTAENVNRVLLEYQSKKYITMVGRSDTSFTLTEDGFAHKLKTLETEVFYLDSAFRLRAYTRVGSYNDMGGRGSDYAIYLFTTEGVVGGIDYLRYEDEVSGENLWRFAKTACPGCGLRLSMQEHTLPVADVVSPDNLLNFTTPILKKMEDTKVSIQKWKKTGAVNGLIKVKTYTPMMGGDGTYSKQKVTRYTLTQEIYDNFVMAGTVGN